MPNDRESDDTEFLAEPRLPDNLPVDVVRAFIAARTAATEESHRLANRLQAAQLQLHLADKRLRQRRWRHFAGIAATILVAAYIAVTVHDEHVERCAVLGRPQPGDKVGVLFWDVDTESFCDFTFPFHEHNRERRLIDDPYLREQIEAIFREELLDGG